MCLNCAKNEISSLQGIEGLINLRSLYGYNNKISSLKGIEGLINLELLSLSFNKLYHLNDFTTILSLPKLKKIYFDEKAHNIPFLKKHLKYIKNINDLIIPL